MERATSRRAAAPNRDYRETTMKTLNKLLVSAMLVALVVCSTALAGSAYAGMAAFRGPGLLVIPFATETEPRAQACDHADDVVADCSPAESR